MMLGQYLKYMRTVRGINQKEFAKKLFIAPCTLSHYENGSRMVPYTILLLAAEVSNFELKIIDNENHKEITDIDIEKEFGN